jgi:hypothetical protein
MGKLSLCRLVPVLVYFRHTGRAFIYDRPSSRDFFEDVCGFGGPDEGLGIMIVSVDVFSVGHDAASGRASARCARRWIRKCPLPVPWCWETSAWN